MQHSHCVDRAHWASWKRNLLLNCVASHDSRTSVVVLSISTISFNAWPLSSIFCTRNRAVCTNIRSCLQTSPYGPSIWICLLRLQVLVAQLRALHTRCDFVCRKRFVPQKSVSYTNTQERREHTSPHAVTVISGQAFKGVPKRNTAVSVSLWQSCGHWASSPNF